jgi:hypothetical protein
MTHTRLLITSDGADFVAPDPDAGGYGLNPLTRDSCRLTDPYSDIALLQRLGATR